MRDSADNWWGQNTIKLELSACRLSNLCVKLLFPKFSQTLLFAKPYIFQLRHLPAPKMERFFSIIGANIGKQPIWEAEIYGKQPNAAK